MTVQAGETLASPPPEAGGDSGDGSSRARDTVRGLIPLIPAVAMIALWMVWIPASGAYFPNAWYPSALGVAALLAVMMIARVGVLPRTRAARIALLSFAALVAWNYLSILWAGSPGSALDASNKLLLYLLVGWAFSLLPWTPTTMAYALAAWAVGVGVFCAVGLIHATGASNLNPFFNSSRYATPLNYPNATAAIAVMGMWPALILSARKEVPVLARALLLALATFLAEFALLPQSRAAVLGLVLTTPLVLIASSDRVRLLLRMAVVGGGLAISAPRTVAVDTAINAGHHVGPPLAHAANGMLETSLAAFVIGALLALAEKHVSFAIPSVRGRVPLGRRGTVALIVGAVLVVGIGGAVAAPSISHEVRTVVKKGNSDAGTGSTRLLSTTPEERFDYARVAWKLFTEDPVQGVGAGNFGRRYDPLRRFQKHSQYAHDVALRALSETGIVGLALTVAVVLALAIGLVKTRLELRGLGGACAVAALGIAAYFLVGDSVDWLDEFPVLAGAAFAFALGAIALRPGERRPSPGLSRPVRVGIGFAAACVTAGVLIALVPAYLETRYVERAVSTFHSRPASAYADLRRATELNPLSADPFTTKGTISVVLGNYALARTAFEQAIGKEDDWYPRLELAVIDAHEGRFQAASSELNAAAKLDADDPVLSDARDEVRERKRIQPAQFDQQLTGGAEAELFAPQGITK